MKMEMAQPAPFDAAGDPQAGRSPEVPRVSRAKLQPESSSGRMHGDSPLTNVQDMNVGRRCLIADGTGRQGVAGKPKGMSGDLVPVLWVECMTESPRRPGTSSAELGPRAGRMEAATSAAGKPIAGKEGFVTRGSARI